MNRRFDVVTFDCYGTLIDWEAGMTQAFGEASTADGVQLDPRDVLRALFDTRPAAELPEYQMYRDRLTDAAMRVGELVRIIPLFQYENGVRVRMVVSRHGAWPKHVEPGEEVRRV